MQDNKRLLQQLAGILQRLKDDNYNTADIIRKVISNLDDYTQDLNTREIEDTKHLRLYCELTKAAVQATVTGAFPFVIWDTVTFNYGNMYDKNNNTYITIPYSGRYIIDVSISFDVAAAGQRQVLITNITTGLFIKTLVLNPVPVGGTHLPVTVMKRFNAGDKIGVQVNQNSGGNLNILAAADYTPVMRVHGLCDLS